MTDKQKYYPELNAKMNFSQMEEEILRIWDDKRIRLKASASAFDEEAQAEAVI